MKEEKAITQGGRHSTNGQFSANHTITSALCDTYFASYLKIYIVYISLSNMVIELQPL